MKPPRERESHHHTDGRVRAQGWLLDGYWAWFRKNGTRLRSGHFDMGHRVGEWTTCDSKGEVYKVTRF